MIFKKGNTLTPTTGDQTPWMTVAKKEIGVTEIAGPKANARIIEYDKATTLKATSDEVAWCSAFANWCMLQAGITGTKSAAARSWLTWSGGEQLKTPRYGCIVVFWRGSRDGWEGHVGFWTGERDGYVQTLGGNQSNSVRIANEPKERVLAYIWPKAA